VSAFAASGKRAAFTAKRGRLRLAASEDVMTGIGTLFMCNQAWPRACRWTTVHPPPCRHLGLLELPAIAQVRAQRGRIDLGLLLPPVDGAEIITDPVWSEEWLAALPKAHPLVRRTKLHATDFDGQNVIIGHAERGPRCGWHVLDLLDTLHVNVRTIAEVEHLHTALMLGASRRWHRLRSRRSGRCQHCRLCSARLRRQRSDHYSCRVARRDDDRGWWRNSCVSRTP
jgi:DNA-binding transcriptional LysR family regulator